MLVLTPEERLGRTIADRYRLVAVLSTGGMGVVFEARDEATHGQVAVKMLKPAHTFEPDRVARFARETRIAASLRHPNIAPVLAVGSDEVGAPFIVMARLEGRSLAEEVELRKVLGLAETLAIILPVARALAAAHAMAVLHRDVKPSNIFLANEGGRVVPKLLDFGIATTPELDFETQTGALLGTPGYMAPEQLRHGECGAYTDVWGLAAVMHRCLIGFPPHGQAPMHDILRRVLHEPVPPVSAPTISRTLGATIDRALARDPERRYRCMDSFARALEAAAFGATGADTRDIARDGATATCEPPAPAPFHANSAPRSESPRRGPRPDGRSGPRRGALTRATMVALGGALLGALLAASAVYAARTSSRSVSRPEGDGDPWACLDETPPPSDPKSSVDVEFVAFDTFKTYTLASTVGGTAFRLVHYTPLPGTTIYGCYLRDVECAVPATPRVVTDAAGVAHLTVSGDAGLYYRVDRADSFPGLYFPGRLVAGEPHVSYPVSTDNYLKSIPLELMIGARANTDPRKPLGHLFATVFDCQDRAVGGVALDLVGVHAGTRFYLADRLPNRNATLTDAVEGTAGFVNVPAGAVQVRATLGARQLTVSVSVRAASATLVDVRPLNRQVGAVSMTRGP